MTQYIDGFVLPIPRAQLAEYRRVARAIGEVWKEHGALDYREYVLDDPELTGTRPFGSAVNATGDEAIIFGWVSFPSREVRDLANDKVAKDARVAKLMSSSETGFDPARMVYGGFRSLVPEVKHATD